LNLISGYVQMLMEEEGEDSRAARRLQIIQDQIAKVTTIVRTMMDHARRPSPREVTDPTSLVERVCEVARPTLDAAHVKLDLHVEAGLPPIAADAVQLELALLNLIANSLDAMPAGGCLSIRLEAADDGVRIQITDTGSGIAADLLPRIFEPWVTTKPAGQGTGLGLSITRDVIGGHGGSIVASSTPGAGATFTIELPAGGARVAAGA
jgi:signal transduction histidine kinase